MGLVLLLLGLAALGAALRLRERRAEWLLSGLLLAGVGFTQVVDSRNAPRNPDFARPREAASQGVSGSALGGGISYKNFRWLEADGKRYVTGEVRNEFTNDWRYPRLLVEVFDSLGNSLGVVIHDFGVLKPEEPVAFRLEVPFPGASRFEVLRFDL